MTPQRLQRLLRSGAHLFARPDGDWDLYRSADRRRRSVCILPAETVDGLLGQGDLLQLPGQSIACLVWSRRAHPDNASAPLPTKPINAALDGKDQRGGSLLIRVLEGEQNPITRRRLAVAAMSWREDHEALQTEGVRSGMNWEAIFAGTRIQGGGTPQTLFSRQSGVRARLQAIQAGLGDRDRVVLRKMIIAGGTRHAVAKSMGLPDRQTERLASQALHRLANLYENSVRRPGQATPSA